MARSKLRHKKDGNHNQVKQAAETIADWVEDTAEYGASYDLLVAFRGHLAMVEIKDPAQLTGPQRENPVLALTTKEFAIHTKAKLAGFPYLIVQYGQELADKLHELAESTE